MRKCMASENGTCKNVFAFGTKCDGYSERCTLRPHYESVENACLGAIEAVRRTFGIKGDKEE